MQGGIVGVALGPRRIERRRLRGIERGTGAQPLGKIGIGDKGLAEGNGIGPSGIEGLLRGRCVKAFIGDVDATELRLELRTEAVGRDMLADAEKCDSAPPELARKIRIIRHSRRNEISEQCELGISERHRDFRPRQTFFPLTAPGDFRVARFKQRTSTTTIFVVDASGSAAANRLAEAKGAVELLLAECYVRRDEVALIAFRGVAAEIVVPPTRSLVRAKRCLAGLPGGGATPLAAALDMAGAMARAIAKKGQSPLVVFLTDGKANMTRAGRPGAAEAEREAAIAARLFRSTGTAALVVDTSPRPRPHSERLADDMGARYLPLPYAGPQELSGAIQASARGR